MLQDLDIVGAPFIDVEAHGTRAVGCHVPGLRAARVVSGTVLATGVSGL